MEYQQDEQYNQYNYDDDPQPRGNNATNGLKIAIVILLVVLIAVSFLYYQSVQRDAEEIELLQADRDTLASQYNLLITDMDSLQFDNDTLSEHLLEERFRADSLMGKLRSERNVSYAKIKAYERELGTLRVTMRGFVKTIDSLDQLNRKLTGENLAYKRRINTLETTTEAAKEESAELKNKIERGAVIKARDIQLRAVNKRGKDVTRARTATQLITTLVLSANELALQGDKTVYVRIISPDGYDLAESQSHVIDFEGQSVPYSASREIKYEGEDLAISVYYNGEDFTSGQYTVHVYMDCLMVGSNVIILK